MKTTRWFHAAEDDPVHIGVYEVKAEYVWGTYSRWNGEYWCGCYSYWHMADGSRDLGMTVDFWRGLAQKP